MNRQTIHGPGVYVIGVTGSIASGKSLVGQQLQKLGVGVFDVDHLTHELLNNPGPTYDQVIARFGADIAPVAGGPIDRKKLGAIVFSNADARRDLEAIMHPAIAELRNQRIQQLAKSHTIVAVLVPLLFETNSQDQYNETWMVSVHEDIQLVRVMVRDGVSEEEAQRKIDAQWPQSQKAKLADRVISNSGSPEQTFSRVQQVLLEARKEATMTLSQDQATSQTPSADNKAVAETGTAPAADLGALGAGNAAAAVAKLPDDQADDGTNKTSTDKTGAGATDAHAPTDTPATDAPQTDPATSQRYHDAMRDFGRIACDQALDQLGDVTTPAAKSSSASMVMTVQAGSDQDDKGQDQGQDQGTTGGQTRELRVDVRMSARNVPGNNGGSTTPPPVDSDKDKSKPVPPTSTDSKGKGDRDRFWPLLAFFGLLAFLVTVAVIWLSYNKAPVVVSTPPAAVNVTANPSTNVTINNGPNAGAATAPADSSAAQNGDSTSSTTTKVEKGDSTVINNRLPGTTNGGAPVTVIADEVIQFIGSNNKVHIDRQGNEVLVDKSASSNSSVKPVGDTLVITQGTRRTYTQSPCGQPAGGCGPIGQPMKVPSAPAYAVGCGKVTVLSEAPDFSRRYLHNQILWQVAEWKLIEGNCSGTVLEGRDGNGRLVVRQFYGSTLGFGGQFTVKYAGNGIEVDHFNSYNTFDGRTIYTLDGAGLLVRAQLLDGRQRGLNLVEIERDYKGKVVSVASSTYYDTGRLGRGVYFRTYGEARVYIVDTFYLTELVLGH